MMPRSKEWSRAMEIIFTTKSHKGSHACLRTVQAKENLRVTSFP